MKQTEDIIRRVPFHDAARLITQLKCDSALHRATKTRRSCSNTPAAKHFYTFSDCIGMHKNTRHAANLLCAIAISLESQSICSSASCSGETSAVREPCTRVIIGEIIVAAETQASIMTCLLRSGQLDCAAVDVAKDVPPFVMALEHWIGDA